MLVKLFERSSESPLYKYYIQIKKKKLM